MRAKVSEGILAASACRTTITEVYQSASTAVCGDRRRWLGMRERCRHVALCERASHTDAVGVVTVTMANVGDAAIDAKTIDADPVRGCCV